MKKQLKAFTLVEMLIVMGIIVILMAVGIASGRAALRNANKIEHQNAAEQIYQALQGYYADNREYPADMNVEALMGDTVLGEYIDEFDGGSEAHYGYAVDSTQQEFLVCVTLGGADDESHLGVYCTGNGIGSINAAITEKLTEYGTDGTGADYVAALAVANGATTGSEWTAAGTW